MKTPQQVQVEQRQRVRSSEFPCPPIPQDLLEWLEGTYFPQPFRPTDSPHVDYQLRLSGQIELVQALRDTFMEQLADNEVDRSIAEGITTPDAGVQF